MAKIVKNRRFLPNDYSRFSLQNWQHCAKLYLSHQTGGINSQCLGEEAMDNQTTVIIADNTEEFCSNLTAMIQRTEGFRVLGTVGDGEQAIRMVM